MNFRERLSRIETKLFAKEKNVEVIFYEAGEDVVEKIKEKEAELKKKIDIPICIKIINKGEDILQ
jgi:hypothetical protein